MPWIILWSLVFAVVKDHGEHPRRLKVRRRKSCPCVGISIRFRIAVFDTFQGAIYRRKAIAFTWLSGVYADEVFRFILIDNCISVCVVGFRKEPPKNVLRILDSRELISPVKEGRVRGADRPLAMNLVWIRL
jgi:hypothetical protein